MNKINRDHISGFIVGILGYKLVSSIFKKSRKIKDSKKLILYRVTREKIIFELNLEAFQLGQNERVRIEILVEGKKQFPELTLDLDNLQEFAQNNTNKLQSYRFSLIDNNGKELIPRCLPINIDGSRYIPEIQDLEKNPDELWQIVRQMHIGINSLKRKLNIMVVGMCNNGKSSFLNTIFTALYQNIYSCSQNFAIFDQHTTNCIAPYKYDDNPFITFFDTPGWEETFKSYIMIETIKGHLRHDLKVSHLQGEEVCVKIDPQNVVPLIDLVILVEKLDYTANLNNTARPSFHKFIREITDSTSSSFFLNFRWDPYNPSISLC